MALKLFEGMKSFRSSAQNFNNPPMFSLPNESSEACIAMAFVPLVILLPATESPTRFRTTVPGLYTTDRVTYHGMSLFTIGLLNSHVCT